MTNDNDNENVKDQSGEAAPQEDELTKCKRERDEYLNGWKRAKADLINYQKDETKRFQEMAKFASMDLVADVIPVLDSFAALERILEGEPRPDAASGRDLTGMRLVQRQLEDVLKKRGLARMIVASGTPFDPAFHESVGETESEAPPGTIAEEIERGYLLHGRVVRPVRVKLSKGTANQH